MLTTPDEAHTAGRIRQGRRVPNGSTRHKAFGIEESTGVGYADAQRIPSFFMRLCNVLGVRFKSCAAPWRP